MGYTVQQLIDQLDELAEENPDAEVKIDPPYSPIYAVYYDEDENTVEMHH